MKIRRAVLYIVRANKTIKAYRMREGRKLFLYCDEGGRVFTRFADVPLSDECSENPLDEDDLLAEDWRVVL